MFEISYTANLLHYRGKLTAMQHVCILFIKTIQCIVLACKCGKQSLYRISIGLIISVGSKYGSNGNYDGNDGFSTSQIENKTRKNTLFFSIRIQYLSQD